MVKRKISDYGLELIKKFESFREEVYLCPAGKRTIGYGHVLRKGEQFYKIDQNQALALLVKDCQMAEYIICYLVDKVEELTTLQFDALVSFVFNVGHRNFQRSTLRQKINRAEHALVPRELMKWVYAAGVKLPGLVKRRMEEANLYMGA